MPVRGDAPPLLDVANVMPGDRDDHRRVPHLFLHHEALLEEVIGVHCEAVGDACELMHHPGGEPLEGREVGVQVGDPQGLGPHSHARRQHQQGQGLRQQRPRALQRGLQRVQEATLAADQALGGGEGPRQRHLGREPHRAALERVRLGLVDAVEAQRADTEDVDVEPFLIENMHLPDEAGLRAHRKGRRQISDAGPRLGGSVSFRIS